MEKTLNAHAGIVHLVDKRRRDSYGGYLCGCGKRVGLFWQKIDKTAPLNCLVCLMREKGSEKKKKP